MTLLRVVGALTVLLLVAGCLDAGAGTSSKKSLEGIGQAVAQKVLPNITGLLPLAEKVLVSPAGHRLAEFMVAKNPLDPNHLIIASQDYDASGTGTMQCVMYVTKDGGATWTQSKPIPGFTRPHLQFDGWVSFDAQGVAHYLCLDYDRFNPAPQTWAYYSQSADGGITWSPATVITPLGGCDKTSLHASKAGRVFAYCSGRLTYTDDGGKKWSPVKNPGGSNPNGFVEDKLGGIYVWVRSRGGSVARSVDGGETWNATVVGPINAAPGYNDQNRWVDQRPWITLPSLAISPLSDNLVVAQQHWNSTTNLFEANVYRSVDRGVSFSLMSTPTFASETCKPCHVTKPTLTIDDAGRTGLLVQLTNEGGHVKEVYFTASPDEGRTWVAPLVLSKTAPPNEWQNPKAFVPSTSGAAGIATHLAANPTDAPNVAVGIALTTAVSELQMRWNGEYWGMASTPAAFVTTWIDHSADGVPQIYARPVKAE